MASIHIKYSDNDCDSIIDDNKPFMFVNFEALCDLLNIRSSLSCDAVYIKTRNRKILEVYFIEFKNIRKNVDEKLFSINRDKFYSSKEIMQETGVLNYKGVRPVFNAVIVYPQDKLNRIRSLMNRRKINVRKFKDFNSVWIACCGESLMNRRIILR